MVQVTQKPDGPEPQTKLSWLSLFSFGAADEVIVDGCIVIVIV